MRYFNTSGPNISANHYTLPREALVQAGIKKVENDRYFTIWAPRQTGKSTYFRLLAQALIAQNYIVLHVNVEGKIDSTEAYLCKFKDGKAQLAYYIKSLGLQEGIYLVFVKNTVTNPKIIESVEFFEGIKISTYLVRYDMETDFG
jgi:hypothetical protein